MIPKPADNVTDLLQKFLDVQTRRAEVISSNIANADTPGYRAKELDFGSYLREAARQSVLPGAERENALVSTPRVIERESEAIGFDGNTVDAGKEMAELAEAGSNFSFGAKMLQSRLRLLRSAIREGR